MNIRQITHRYPFYKHVNEKFAMWKVSGLLLNKQAVDYSEAHSLIFVLHGTVKIRIGARPLLHLDSQCFIDLIGIEDVAIVSASDDSLCFNLIFSESIIDELFQNDPPFPLSYIMENQNKPIKLSSDKYGSRLLRRLRLLDEVVSDKSHLFFDERLLNALMLLYLDMADIYIMQQRDNLMPNDSDRKKELFVRFARLCSKNVTRNHSVAFYASTLCITPQYLARIVREFTHFTVYRFIQKCLIGECLKLLKDTDKTVLQISEELNFSDQATFTKYFKRSTGMSPTEYRRDNAKSGKSVRKADH